jgi:hypothetical protein
MSLPIGSGGPSGGGDYGPVRGHPCIEQTSSGANREGKDAASGKDSAHRPPKVTCRSWLVADAITGEPLLWQNPTEKLQVSPSANLSVQNKSTLNALLWCISF